MARPIRRILSLLLLAGVMGASFATAPASGSSSSPSAVASEPNAEEPPSRKYCKHHRKRCKRNAKRAAEGGAGYGVAVKFWGRRGNLSGESQAREVAEESVDGNIWWSDSVGEPYRRGCGKVKGVTHRHGWIFNDLHYQMSLEKRWCWRRGVIRKGTVEFDKDLDHVAWYANDKGDQEWDNGFYLYEPIGKQRSGHKSEWRRHMQLCFFAQEFVCLFNAYPRVSVYLHGDGTAYMSGHSGMEQ